LRARQGHDKSLQPAEPLGGQAYENVSEFMEELELMRDPAAGPVRFFRGPATTGATRDNGERSA